MLQFVLTLEMEDPTSNGLEPNSLNKKDMHEPNARRQTDKI